MKTFSHLRRALAVLVIGLLALPSLTLAASGGKSPAAIKPVSLGINSNVQVRDVSIVPATSGSVLALSATWTNGGSKPLDLTDYFIQVDTGANKLVTMQVLPEDGQHEELGAKSAVGYRYFAKIGANAQLSDLSLKIMKWDFSAANFQRLVGQLAVPAGYAAAMPADAGKTVIVDDHNFAVKVKQAGMSANDEYLFPAITMEWTNLERAPVPLPDVQFAVRTKAGYLYPLESSITTLSKLKPLEAVEVSLTGSLPVSVENDGWELMLTRNVQTGATDSFAYPVADFRLSALSAAQETGKKSYAYTNDKGTYTLQLDSAYRLPWEGEDILEANIAVVNNGKQPLPMLSLGGGFTLDGQVSVDATVVLTDKMIGLQPGQRAQLRLIGKIPYTYDFSALAINVRDVKRNADIVSFASVSDLTAVSVVPEGQSFELAANGRRFTGSLLSAELYQGSETDLYSVSIKLENKGARDAEIPQLTAYFQGDNGKMFPATVDSAAAMTISEQASMVQITAVVPKDYGAAGTKLLLGQSVTGSGLTEAAGKAEAYVDPIVLRLPAEVSQANRDWTRLSIEPYTLTISHASWPFFYYNQAKGGYDITFRFDYELTRDFSTQMNTDSHKYVLELADADGRVLVSQAFALGERPGDTAAALAVGADTGEVTGNIEGMSFNSNSYTLNIYDQYQQYYKRLLASKRID